MAGMESWPESGSSGRGQLPRLTISELKELRYIERYGTIDNEAAARSIAAKLFDKRAFEVQRSRDVVVDWHYVLEHLDRLFSDEMEQ